MNEQKIRLVIPKGKIMSNVMKLLNDAGINLYTNDRLYRPIVDDKDMEIKIMKTQNIPTLVELGSHDIGFTGYDWIVETGAQVTELLDLHFDPVRIIAAIPKGVTLQELKSKRIIVASEYENISKIYLQQNNLDYVFLRTYGATEVYPPDDADMIIDNTSTGQTLEEHNLSAVATILESSTRFIANRKALENPAKAEKIEEMTMMFQAILDARERVMLEMNVPKDKFTDMVKSLPCMRSPTVSPLYGEQGYAVKVAVKKHEVRKLLPLLKKLGATDILEYKFEKVVL